MTDRRSSARAGVATRVAVKSVLALSFPSLFRPSASICGRLRFGPPARAHWMPTERTTAEERAILDRKSGSSSPDTGAVQPFRTGIDDCLAEKQVVHILEVGRAEDARYL